MLHGVSEVGGPIVNEGHVYSFPSEKPENDVNVGSGYHCDNAERSD